jgi:hypothetical protein
MTETEELEKPTNAVPAFVEMSIMNNSRKGSKKIRFIAIIEVG